MSQQGTIITGDVRMLLTRAMGKNGLQEGRGWVIGSALSCQGKYCVNYLKIDNCQLIRPVYLLSIRIMQRHCLCEQNKRVRDDLKKSRIFHCH